jgi:hypothetical protein
MLSLSCCVCCVSSTCSITRILQFMQQYIHRMSVL